MNAFCCPGTPCLPLVEPLEARISPAALISLVDSDGDRYTLKLTGPGTFVATQAHPGSDSPLDSIVLSDTTAKSALSITVKKVGDGKVGVDSITGGRLGSLTAPAATLGSSLVLTGVGSVTLGDVGEGAMLTLGGAATETTKVTLGAVGDHFVLQSAAKLGAVTAARLGNGTIVAAALASLTTKTGGILADLKIAGAVGKISAAGATAGAWMAASFGAVSSKGGNFDADLIATAPLGTKPTIASVAVSGGDFTGSVSATGAVGAISAKAVKGVGGAIMDPLQGVTIAGASLVSLSAGGDLNADVTFVNGIKSIAVAGNAAGAWSASFFGTIKVTDGALSATVDATALQMPAGKTPAIASIAISGGSISGDITADGTIAAISVAAKKGIGGAISGAQIAAKNIGSVVAFALTDSTIFSGAGGIAGPFAAGTINKLAFVDVDTSTIGAGFSTTDAILQNGDDKLITGGLVKAFSISGSADASSYFAAASFPVTVKIGKAKIAPPTDARFFTTGTADVRAPLLSAGLAHDTGISSTDSITADATIEGKVVDASAIAAFVGGLDGTLPANFTSVLAKLRANGSFTLDLATLEMLNGGPLTDGPHTVHLRATDAANNATDVFDIDFTLTGFQVTAHTPTLGAGEVGVTYHPQVYFSKAVDPATLNANNFYATFGGTKIPATIVPANDGSFAWLFFADPMPNSSQIQVTVDGATIMAADGSGALDAAGTAMAGSKLQYSYSTVSVTAVGGTTLSGRIVDPGTDKLPMTADDYNAGPDGIMHTADDVFLHPIAGVKVYILGLENQAVLTDAQGNFHLTNVPAGDVKIAIEGNVPSVTAPSGFYFPDMVMDAQMKVGQDNQIMPEMKEMYLPRLASAILHNVSASSGMMIAADDAGAHELTMQQQAELTINVPANSFVDDNGQPMSTANIGISTVPGSLVKDMLPAGVLEHSFDITVQAPGVTKFSTPAAMTFPNVFNAAPGEKLNFLSFDHTTGRLVIEGTGTVSDDGLTVSTDPGTGITHPGWHAVAPPGSPAGGPDGPPPPQPPPCIDSNDLAKQVIDFGKSIANCALQLSKVDFYVKKVISLVGQANNLAGDIKTLLNTHSDSLSQLSAGLDGFNNAKQLIVTGFEIAKGTANPVQTVINVIDCVNSLVAQAKDLCNAIQKGPCGNDTLKLVCLGLDTADIIIGKAKNLSDIAKAAEKGLTGVALKLVCGLIDDTVKTIKVAQHSNFAAPRAAGQQANLNDTPPQAVLDSFHKLSDAAQAYADMVTPLGTFLGDVGDLTTQLGEVDTNSTTFYNQTHDAPKNAYWSFDYKKADGTDFQLRGRANEFGKIEAFLPPKTAFTLTVYDQNDNRLATYQGMSGESGTPTAIPQLAFVTTVGLPDRDGDGLVDAAETAVGTDPTKADTNGDGISDFAAVKAGLDPLAGTGFPTGIIANLPVAGQATKVALSGKSDGAGQTAYIAAGTGGLAIVDASKLSVPILLSQIALPGNATDVAIDPTINTAIVAGNAGGVSLVDVSNPTAPSVIATINVNATQVEAFDGIAYVAVGSKLNAYDPANGALLQTLNVGNNAITDVVREGGTLFVMDAANVLHSIDISTSTMVAEDTLTLPQGGGKLTVANGIAYATATSAFNGGFDTADVSNPHHLALISGSDLPGNLALAKNGIAVNGSGLGLLTGSIGISNVVELVDVSDPQATASLLTSFTLPAAGLDVAIGSGIAFVADGASGLQVVNYRAFDAAGIAPTVTLASNAVDLDAGTPGLQLTEGSELVLRVGANDDVQVRRVDLLLNGAVVASDVSAPFDFVATLPKLSDGATATLQVRATDTGGNSSISNSLVVNLQADTVAPVLIAKSPDKAGFDVKSITLRFNEAINGSLLDPAGFTLTNLGADGVLGGGDDSAVTIASLNLPSAKRLVIATADVLPFANYLLTVNPSVIADFAGNHPATTLTDAFTSYNLDPNTKIWVSDTNGDWNNAANWADGVVPGTSDPVFIDRIGFNVTVTHASGNFDSVKNLINHETLVISSGRITATGGTSDLGGTVTLSGGSFAVSGSTSIAHIDGVLNFNGGGLYAQNGARLDFPGLVSLNAPVSGAQIEADDANTIIDLTTLTTLHGAMGNNALSINAVNGGKVDLHNVTTIPDGSTEFRSINAGSLINLSALTTFIDDTSFAQSYLSAESGTITVPNLVNLTNLDLYKDGATASLNTSQITNIDTVRLFASGGATLDFSQVTSYTQPAFDVQLASADGAGSLVKLTGLTTLHGASGNNALSVRATNGGKVDLSHVTTIPDGSARFDSINSGAIIDLSALTTFIDNTASAQSYLNADTATVLVPNLVNLTNVDLYKSGATSSMNTAQITNIDTVRLFASAGATLDFSQVTSYTQPAFDVQLAQADGAGSLVKLTGLTTLHGASGNNVLNVRAINGGKVDLSHVTTIPDGSARFDSINSGAMIDLSALTTFIDNTASVQSYLNADGATVLVPNLVNLTNVDLYKSGATSSMNTAQITNIDTVRLFASSGATLDFSQVTSYTQPAFDVQLAQADGVGSLVKLTGLTMLHGGSGNNSLNFRATNGGKVDLSHVTTIPDGSTKFDSINSGAIIDLSALTTFIDNTASVQSYLNADGATVLVPNLVNLTNVDLYKSGATSNMNTTQITNIDTVRLFASSGATLDFSQVTSYTQPAFDVQLAQADGVGSLVKLTGLTMLHGGSGNNSLNFRATNGGKVDLSHVTTIPDGSTKFDSINSGAIIDLSALTTFIDNTASVQSYLNADGATILVPNLVNLTNLDLYKSGATSSMNTAQITNIDTVRLFASSGATLDFSQVTSYTQPAFDVQLAQADGAGSLVKLTGLTTLHGGSGNSALNFRAVNGGKVDLSHVTTIPDGSARFDSINSGAIIDLSALTSFIDNTASAQSYLNADAATILVPNLIALTNLDLYKSGATSSLNTTQITNIDTVRLFASNGATLDLSNVTSFTAPNSYIQLAQADGTGSVVKLTGLTMLHGAAGNSALSFIAQNGGKVDLHNVTSIPDGSTEFRSINAGSMVDLSGLTTFTDSTPGSATSYISAENGGSFQLTAGSLNATAVEFYVDGPVSVGTLTLAAGSKLSGSSTLTGNLVNSAGEVRPGNSVGVLTINGNFTQGAAGTLFVEIGGLTAGTPYDQLVVTGTAMLAGTLNVADINGFIPAVASVFQIMSYGSVIGTFGTITDNEATRTFNSNYNPTNLTLNVS